MEFKTTKNPGELENSDAGAPPDKSMYLRRKTTQKIQKSYSGSRILMRMARVAGKMAVLLFVAGFLSAIFFYAYSSRHFVLHKPTIHGCRHVDPQRIEEILRKEFPPQIVRIDLKNLRARLEQETWVRKVELRRILPSDLVIYVQERSPAVILELRGELMLADEEAVLLDRYDSKYGKLDVPVFKGLLGDSPEGYRQYQEENAERVRLGLRMMAELDSGSSAFTRGISEVDLSDRTNARVTLVDDTAEILLGDRDFLKRFRTLMANMAQYQELKSRYNDIASVDLRFDGQIVYKPRKTPGDQVASTAEARKP